MADLLELSRVLLSRVLLSRVLLSRREELGMIVSLADGSKTGVRHRSHM